MQLRLLRWCQNKYKSIYEKEFKKNIITELSIITAILPETEVHFYIVSLGENYSFIFELYFWVHFDEERAFAQIVDQAVLIMQS